MTPNRHVVGEKGIGKRTDLGKYRPQSRGGKVFITMDITDETGEESMVEGVVVDKTDKLTTITHNMTTIQGFSLRSLRL